MGSSISKACASCLEDLPVNHEKSTFIGQEARNLIEKLAKSDCQSFREESRLTFSITGPGDLIVATFVNVFMGL